MKNFTFCLRMLTVLLVFAAAVVQGQNLRTDLAAVRQKNDLMGGVVVAFCKNRVLESVPFGTADLQRNVPVTDSTLFRIASVSKVVTAIAAMQLAEKGTLNLDADINTILGYSVRNPNFPNTAITTRMLLSHTSTIIDGTKYGDFLTATYAGAPIPNMSELLTAAGKFYVAGQFNKFDPGTYFNYSNVNFGIAATVIEKAAGVRFDQYCRQNIFMPLGIKGSFNVDDIQNISNVAVLYRKVSGTWTPQWDDFKGVKSPPLNLTGYLPGTNGLFFAPQGGLRISGVDLSKIFMALLNGGTAQGVQILKPASVSAMINPKWQYNGSNGNNYFGLFRSWGLGIHRITNTAGNDLVLPGSKQMFGHPGEAYGLVSDAYIDTARNVGFVFLTNGSGTGYNVGKSAYYTIEDEVFAAIEKSGNIASCASVGVTDKDNPVQIEVYPNPVAHTLYVRTNSAAPVHQFRLYDLLGRMVVSQSFAGESTDIPVAGIPNGIYLLSMDGVMAKIVKE